MKTILGAWAIVCVMGCGKAAVPGELDSWKGRSKDELASHAVFATMPLDRRPLSDGAELWIFRRCATDAPTYVVSGGVAMPIGGDTGCCFREFTIRSGIVERVQFVGDCGSYDELQPR